MQNTSNKKGCIREPLVDIPVCNNPPDMLHLRKCVISKLISQLVDWVIIQGKEEKLLSEMKTNKIPFT